MTEIKRLLEDFERWLDCKAVRIPQGIIYLDISLESGPYGLTR